MTPRPDEPTSRAVAGLVLAAGAGRRFGRPKAPVVIDGERLVDRAVRCLRDAGCEPVVVVLGAWVGDVPSAQIVVNAGWAEGMGSSLRAGLQALESLPDVTDALVTLVDLPGLTPAAARRVAESPGVIAVAAYSGVRGHPVRLPRSLWPTVAAMAIGDEGARRFLQGRDDIDVVEVGDAADGDDLDTPTP